MTDGQLHHVARLMRVTLEPERPVGSMSGSQVHRVVRHDGSTAILKLTSAVTGPQRRSAERELAVYTDLRDRLPVRLPELLDSHADTDSIGVLLTRHEAVRPSTGWSARNWAAMAADLAELHCTALPEAFADDPESWLISRLRSPVPEAVREFWHQHAASELVAPLLDRAAELISEITWPQRCLVHGDCHTDNILVQGEELIWTDWQGVGRGDPAAELAFASTRATPAGAILPLAGMIDSYADHRGIDAEQFARSVLAAELAISIFAWPEYAQYNSAEGVARIRRRVHQLARRWQHES